VRLARGRTRVCESPGSVRGTDRTLEGADPMDPGFGLPIVEWSAEWSAKDASSGEFLLDPRRRHDFVFHEGRREALLVLLRELPEFARARGAKLETHCRGARRCPSSGMRARSLRPQRLGEARREEDRSRALDLGAVIFGREPIPEGKPYDARMRPSLIDRNEVEGDEGQLRISLTPVVDLLALLFQVDPLGHRAILRDDA